ncbi:holin family protein [Amaricoccus sp.]|uniref:holin family protein n=1 Tax=Amaricoccus sp. TaxID=1872485 RepID=UPI0039E56580
MTAILGAGGAARQIGDAVGGVAEVFVGNQAEREAGESREALAAVAEFGAEFARAPVGWFDGFVDGLNRLPRPLLTLGTLGLFVYAMAAPNGFTVRMRGLDTVPEPLWWLLGAIVSFYFGARELHHQRNRAVGVAQAVVEAKALAKGRVSPVPLAAVAGVDPDRNAAVEDWRRTHR